MTSNFTPTHIIRIDGRTIPVHLTDGAAYTRQEWDCDGPADWECGPDGWTFQGRPTKATVDVITNQPSWKLLWSTDTEALYTDETEQYDPELAILSEYETRRGTTRYHVYRFSLERYKIATKREDHEDGTATTAEYLVPYAYDATWPHAASK